MDLNFFNFDKRSTSQTIFINATSKFNNKESKKDHVVSHHKRSYDRNNFYVNRKNNVFRPICYIVMQKVILLMFAT